MNGTDEQKLESLSDDQVENLETSFQAMATDQDSSVVRRGMLAAIPEAGNKP